MPLHELLGEALARLQLRGPLCGPKNPQAAPREFIHHTDGQRNFRPYHGQVRLYLVRHGKQAGQALGIAGHASGFLTNAAIPGQATDL
jgi:hypothetical protein